MRKFIRISTALFALVMVISVMPFTRAAGEEAELFRIPIKKITSDSEPVFGYECFALGADIYDENGNKVASLPSGETVYTIGKNCVISMIIPDDIIDIEIIGDIDYELTYKVYEFDGKTLKHVKTYESKNKLDIILPYNMAVALNSILSPTGTADLTDDFALMYTTVISLDVETESGEPQILGYEVLDSYGKTVYSESGYKAAIYIGDGIVAVTNENGSGTLVSGFDSEVKKAGINGSAADLVHNGLITYLDRDFDYYGICNANGEMEVFPDFVLIEHCEDYFIAHADPEVYGRNEAVVFDKNGDGVYSCVDRELEYYNGTVAVSYDDDQAAQMIFADSGEVIAEADIYTFDDGYHHFMNISEEEVTGMLYNSEGKLVADNVYRFMVDQYDGTLIVCTFDDMKYYRYDENGNKLGEILTDDFIITAGAKGLYFATDQNSGVYLASELGRLTESHSMIYTCAVGSETDAYVMADSDYDTYGIEFTIYIVDESPMPFVDVAQNNWAYESILAVYENGIMEGTGGVSFSPKADVSRAQVVTILWRMAGEPSPTADSAFTDVPRGKWYSTAVAWASEKGIVEGVGGGKFAPARTITRAELAVMLYRYADVAGIDTTARADVSSFPDGDEVKSWGIDGISWCVAEGLINGKTAGAGNTPYLAPGDKLTRAEIAAVISRCDFTAEE